MAASAVMAALALSGCSNTSQEGRAAAPTATSSPVAETPTELETTAPEVEYAPVSISVEIECSDGSDSYASYADAWPGRYSMCEGTVSGDEPSPKELKALTTAYGEISDGDFSSLGTLYAMCAENAPDSFIYLEQAGSPAQITEVQGALLLCPDHPQKSRIAKLLTGAKENNRLADEGKIFGSGVLIVSKDVQPGTYVTTDVTNCYWERTDRNGNPIDNYFTAGAARVQVTIRASDFSFNSEGCGEWRPAS
ncbi:hypothetical protein ACFWR4_13175 [Streptomyces hydrogenans]|uniref:hypothetical protein n=1 Tax=Streptomyces hydrogenans TaxID=1873719 RepID=UPI0036647F5D